MIKEQASKLIKEIVNQISSLASISNFVLLFPRLDFKGLGYIPQLFFIFVKHDLIEENLSSVSSARAVIDFTNTKSEYVNFNITPRPEIVTINKGILSSIYDQTLIRALRETPFMNSALEFNSNFIKMQFRQRFNLGVYYSMYSPSVGFHEVVSISSLKLKDTVYLEEVEISLQVKICKTFNILTYKG
ncbi:hypothetical protein B1U23_06250 (plasmid) [Borreliella burgdorferi]|uniref:Uncharacterized protein n=1 Tax=Borreliella burgdorferi (strain ATCC 35210 / DSM 4680 / CIP 102532 / B31) TaxID=224326 RepID=O50944_BORBU|nr:DUF792 family protein [Borreliella burgdorferi]AAC66283.1 conserved hypothetical protein [Borreliella burgdorferi B31]ARS30951.1 hypothetical protein B1U23_06250 [Borreliella burgdorferi]ARS32209.1 hypothetical protein B1U22_06385 [Borreliella burgdorferi]ARS32693.1 hypothetical protein B1U21_02285 [Borreliella burgdorferi]MCD2399394.1 DUF792 family protein [Borreliella burgdorferi]